MARSQVRPIAWIKPDRDSPVSMQVQIVEWLQSLIVSGQLGAGDRLPAESTLVERLGVSRVTVRLAFDELVARGVVTRSHGKGSFVSSRVVQHDLSSGQGFFDILLSKAEKPETRLLEFSPQTPPPRIAALFALDTGQPAVKIGRLYLSAGRPLAFFSSWLTPDAIGLSRDDVEKQSTATMHANLLHRPIASTTVSIGAEIAGAATARLLGMQPRDAVLVLNRSRYDARGSLRDIGRFTTDPSRYELTVSDGDKSFAPLTLRGIGV